MSVEFHEGQLHLQWVPTSGRTCGAEAIQVRPCGDECGRGAFALQRIKRGTCIGEYEGELLDEEHFWARYPSGTADYCMRIDRTWTLDALARAGDDSTFSACFINHSRQRWNVRRRIYRRDRRILLFTARDIAEHEELLLDYGSQFWHGREHQEIL
ncbi:hypothetical protein WJX81_001391 [Elliptochloris bilobata]|uniref:SET domain-containing protein n=1 Tax=Elliptochloris bilobata TaxID=381761 RepID=A0AAW1RS10_9CHLO